MWTDRTKHVVAGSLFVVWLLTALSVGVGQESGESNLQVMHRLLKDGILGLVDSLSLPRSFPLALRVLPQGTEEAWFVQTRLLEELSRQGYPLLTAEGGLPTEGLELQLRVDELAVRLHEAGTHGDSLQREVRVQLSGFLRDSGGKVLWGGVLSKQQVDTVARRDVARLEESPYEFTYFHESGKGSGVQRLLESAAMGTALAIITYLFFSYRTR